MDPIDTEVPAATEELYFTSFAVVQITVILTMKIIAECGNTLARLFFLSISPYTTREAEEKLRPGKKANRQTTKSTE